MDNKVNLMNYSKDSLKLLFESWGEKPFRATQISKWIHQYGICDFDEMTDLSKNLREKLKTVAVVMAPKVILDKPSIDGTRKWLIQMEDSNNIETVYIPEDNRGTLCISSQVGCTLNCSFCSTGKQGFNRNLTTAEIIGQLWVAVRALSQENGIHDKKVTNIVMMGMGEPLLNFDNVTEALKIMVDDHGYALSKKRVTVSTSGIVPAMYKLLDTVDVSLAVSLHAGIDSLRNQLVPINKKYNIDELLKACIEYSERGPHKKITFEYTMMEKINDNIQNADELIEVLENVPCKINLIPFNPYPGTIYKKPSNNRIHKFRKHLQDGGFIVTIRKTRGDDIDAACGQLVGKVNDRTNRKAKHLNSLK